MSEKISKKQKRQESCDLQKRGIVLGCALMPLPATVDRREFTLDYLFVCVVWKNTFLLGVTSLLCADCPPRVASLCNCALYSCDSS